LDWILVPRDEEQAIVEAAKKKMYQGKQTVVPYEVHVPPLMKEFVSSELQAFGFKVTEDMFFCRRKLETGKQNNARLNKTDDQVPKPEYIRHEEVGGQQNQDWVGKS